MNNQPVDQQALNLTHAIALQESSSGGMTPDYNAVGDNGTSKGAYQWQPGNFEAAAKTAGLDPNDFSPENQDKVAYSEVKAYKDKGYDPGQIASLWNSGSPNNWQNHSGTTTINGKQIAYDTPAYVKGVQKYYQQLSGQSGLPSVANLNTPQGNMPGLPNLPQAATSPSTPQTPQTPATPTTPDTSLGGELTQRASDIGNELQQGISGQINPASAGLQAVGSVAGGVNDVVQKGLELIPGVKQVENLIGQGIGSLASSPVGKPVAEAIKSFATAHPELAGDIGAGFNIATAIPIFTGLGAVKNLVTDGVSNALQGVAEKSAINDLTEVTSRTVGGRNLLSATPDAIETLVKERAIPSIEAGKYATEDASSILDSKIGGIDDELQSALAKANTNQVADRLPLETYRQTAIAEAKDNLVDDAPVNKLFDRIQAKYGDYPTLQEMNDAKRLVSKQISESAFGSDVQTTGKLVRSALQHGVEDGANQLGLPDVSEINGRMAKLIKAQNALKYIEGKTVKTGLIRGLLQKTVGAAAGAGIGSVVGGGVPGEILGGYIGERASGALKGILGGNKVGGIVGGLLK